MTKFTAPIVGMSFRPPAFKVLSQLPFGTELWVKRQPDNPYDPNACQVLLPGFSASGSLADLYKECLIEALPDDLPAGRNLWNVSALTDPLFVGFISAKTGHAEKLADILDKANVEPCAWPGKLCGTLEGNPAIELEIPNGPDS